MAYFFKKTSTSDIFEQENLFDFNIYAPLDLSFDTTAYPLGNIVNRGKGPLFASKDGPLYAIINGGPGDDILNGTTAADTINGLGGNDTINGGGGAGFDNVDGGDGDDIFLFTDGSNTQYNGLFDGGAGTDTIRISGTGTFDLNDSTSLDFLSIEQINFAGGSGTRTLLLSAEEISTSEISTTALIDGANNPALVDLIVISMESETNLDLSGWTFVDWNGAGNETITINGDASSETITGSTQVDIINSGAGNDTLNAGEGADTVDAGDGDDTITDTEAAVFGTHGADVYDGGTGTNTLIYTVAHNDTVEFNLATGFQTVAGSNRDSFSNIQNLTISGSESIVGDSGANVLTANGIGANTIDGGAGDDTINSGGGNDTISDGSGADTVNGGDGDDTLMVGTGADTINGDAGDDIFDMISGFDTSTVSALDGGTDTDLFSFDDYGDDYSANLTTGEWRRISDNLLLVTLANIENVDGGTGDDTITGTSGANVLNGGAGNDTINAGPNGGLGVEDTVDGGVGNDTITSSGNGTYLGGVGDDTLIGAGTSLGSFEILDGGVGTDTLDLTTTNITYEVDMITGDTNYTPSFGESFINFENIVMGNGTNTVSGTLGNNNMTGGTGADTFAGLAGADTMDGGAGSDTLDYSASGAAVTVDIQGNTASGGDAAGDVISNFENIEGSAFDDILTSSMTGGTLNGNDGNDTMTVSAGLNGSVLNGGNGDDILTSAVTMNGSDLDGGAGNDTLTVFNDSTLGAFDTADGGTGDDTVIIGLTDILDLDLDGGADTDTLSLTGLGNSFTVDLGAGTLVNDVSGDAVTQAINFENLIGSSGADTITGTMGDNYVNGGAGADNINTGGGNDTVQSGTGADIVNLGDGDDTMIWDNANGDASTGENNDGGAGTDTLVTLNWGAGSLAGGTFNLATGVFSAGATTSNFENYDGTGNTGSNENVTGTSGVNSILMGSGTNTVNAGGGDDIVSGGAGDDTLNGGSGNDTINGEADNDTLNGQGGDDILDGGDGNDVLFGGLGDDNLTGGLGNDRLVGNAGVDTMVGNDGIDRLFGGAGNDVMDGGAGNDVMNGLLDDDNMIGGDGLDRMVGGGGNDVMDGGAGNDVMDGGSGHDNMVAGAGIDRLIGGTGSDTMDAGDGDDVLFGGAGNDRIIGGAGNDRMTGDGQLDTFVFDFGTGPGTDLDTIQDFAVGVDTIEINGGLTYGDLDIIQSGVNVLVRYDGHRILVRNVTVAQMDAAQFSFPPLAEAPGDDKSSALEDFTSVDVTVSDVLEVNDSPVVSDEDSFVFVDKAAVSDSVPGVVDTAGLDDFVIDQDILAEFLEAVQDLRHDHINSESMLEINAETDTNLAYFTNFIDFA